MKALQRRRAARDDDEERNQSDPREGVKLEIREREDKEECAGACRAPLGPRYYLPHRGGVYQKENFFGAANQG